MNEWQRNAKMQSLGVCAWRRLNCYQCKFWSGLVYMQLMRRYCWVCGAEHVSFPHTQGSSGTLLAKSHQNWVDRGRGMSETICTFSFLFRL